MSATWLMQYEFTFSDVEELDRAIYKHQKIYNTVPQYDGLFKPKHVFAHQQYPVDIGRNGTP
eukprot:5710716-Pleurochrysis_carterae.AAC.1